MKTILKISVIPLLLISSICYSQKEIQVSGFDKIIISPHIETTIVKGDHESVKIESISVDESKLNVEVNGNNLRVYLEDAKEFTKNEKVSVNGHVIKKPIYHGTVAKLTITYKFIDELSIRGEEKFLAKSHIQQDDFTIKIYGESEIHFSSIDVKDLSTTIYGEAHLTFDKGSADYQKYTAYGECKVDALNIESYDTKITAHGEAQFQVDAKETLKVTSYGEPVIKYTGNPEIRKGIMLGDATITSINK